MEIGNIYIGPKLSAETIIEFSSYGTTVT